MLAIGGGGSSPTPSHPPSCKRTDLLTMLDGRIRGHLKHPTRRKSEHNDPVRMLAVAHTPID